MMLGHDLSLESGPIRLSAPHLLVNGEVVDAEPNWHRHHSRITGKPFRHAELLREGDTLQLALRQPELEWRPASFGLRFQVTGVERFLQLGYHSWDGSGYRELPPAGQSLEGFAAAQLVSQDQFLHLGFLRHDRFQHRFTLRQFAEGLVLDVEVLWDLRAPLDGRDFVSEPLLMSSGMPAEELLRAWAERVAAHSPLPPRNTAPIRGWCSWYNLYASITEENLLEHLRGTQNAVKQHNLPMHVFQIDDGFTPEMGDWLEVKPQFPRGMKPLLDDIRAAGFKPGLWIAPFLVGNRSHLYAQHPEWVVVDRQTNAPLICMHFYGEFRWHKRSEEYYLLDTTHPEAMAYLRRVLRTWRRDWGCEYFKTDFMYYLAEYGPERVKHHRDGQTRAEIWVEAAQAIREEIGDATWLGCGAPLWMPVGLIDALRIGRDVGARWDTGVKAEQHLENLAVRNFAHGILWQADPDCLLLREKYHYLTDGEIEALARTSAMIGGVMTTSDDLAVLSPERLQLWEDMLGLAGDRCDFPLLGTPLGRKLLVQLRKMPQGWLLHLLNPSNENFEAEVPWSRVGLHGVDCVHVLAGAAQQGLEQQLCVNLEAHAASFLRVQSLARE